jgi:hypothetical protein
MYRENNLKHKQRQYKSKNNVIAVLTYYFHFKYGKHYDILYITIKYYGDI